MTSNLKLKDVFTPGGQPSVTYVSRDHLKLEQRVKEALARGYAINVVTGPTKSGKTVLCNHVLSQAGASVSIEGGQIRTDEEFWSQIAHQLELGRERVRTESGSQTDTASGGLKLGIANVAEINFGGDSAVGRTTERSITYDVNHKLASLQHMVDNDVALLVDDFHYIPQDVQKSIIQTLKGAVFKGLSVILLAVPHRAFDPITVEQEL
ncbi:AAA family ATPase [Sphingopyxis sp. J-6]|uniref:AAA family ATPase n=1 Tax=Sphingopyxis sp. J-6 TaxID=3122054 RepID=UPI0039842309